MFQIANTECACSFPVALHFIRYHYFYLPRDKTFSLARHSARATCNARIRGLRQENQQKLQEA